MVLTEYIYINLHELKLMLRDYFCMFSFDLLSYNILCKYFQLLFKYNSKFNSELMSFSMLATCVVVHSN